MIHTSDALILRTYALGESDRIVVFLTRDRGKKRGVAKNARQSRRRFGGALEPMTCGRVTYREHERRELVFLQAVAPTRSPLTAVDGDAVGYGGEVAELIDEWAQDHDPSETLYRLGTSIVDALSMGVPVEPLARYFEFWLLRLQGVYQPDPDASVEAVAFLTAARSCRPLGLLEVPVSSRVLRELELVHRAQITLHLEKELKSVRVLLEMRRTS